MLLIRRTPFSITAHRQGMLGLQVQGPGGLIALPDDVLSKRRAANPRDNVGDGEGTGVSVGGNIEYP